MQCTFDRRTVLRAAAGSVAALHLPRALSQPAATLESTRLGDTVFLVRGAGCNVVVAEGSGGGATMIDGGLKERSGELLSLLRSELSIYTGYPYKAGSKVNLVVDGGKTFELYTHEETAWAQNANEDLQIAEAMRSGNAMVITGTSSRGTMTTDRYSLSGFTAAHKAIDAACPKK